MCVAFANAKVTHIFSTKSISIYAIFNDQSFNDTLTNDIVRFEQLGPGVWSQWEDAGVVPVIVSYPGTPCTEVLTE